MYIKATDFKGSNGYGMLVGRVGVFDFFPISFTEEEAKRIREKGLVAKEGLIVSRRSVDVRTHEEFSKCVRELRWRGHLCAEFKEALAE